MLHCVELFTCDANDWKENQQGFLKARMNVGGLYLKLLKIKFVNKKQVHCRKTPLPVIFHQIYARVIIYH